MKEMGSGHFSLSIAERVGLVSFLAAIPLWFYAPRVSSIPLSIFLLLCIAAPFFPRFGFYLPVISRGKSGKKAVALTFDDGPDPFTTPEILRLLSKYNAKATFFVTGENASEHPDLIKEIILQGHTIGSHTYSHDHWVLLRGRKRLTGEIQSAHRVLTGFGINPLAFRPPVGMTGPGLHRVLRESGLYVVNFSCRAFDRGNRRIRDLSTKILRKICPDDIILLHDATPKKKDMLSTWLNEVDGLLSGIKAKGFSILPLSEMIGRPVMTTKNDE